MNITRDEAIAQLLKLLYKGYSIPMCSLGNGGTGFCWADSDKAIDVFVNLCKYSFNIIPMYAIADDFEDNGIEPYEYEACVEFKENAKENPYRVQYLLWGFKYLK